MSAEDQEQCKPCEGTGLSVMGKYFYDQWYGRVSFDPATMGRQPIPWTHVEVLRLAVHNTYHNVSAFYKLGDERVEREARRLIGMWNRMWAHHLSQADLDALWEDGYYLRRPFPEKPTIEKLNDWTISDPLGMDGGAMFCCVEARCKRLGVAFKCSYCGGDGKDARH